MRWIREAVLALLVAVFLLVPISPPMARAEELVSSEAAQTHLRAATRALDLQSAMPEDKNEIKPENHAPRVNLLPRDLAQVLLWASCFAIVVIILMTMHDNLWSTSRSRRLRTEEGDEAVPAAAVMRMDKAQLEADDLARQGSFAEAMHVLLLQSVGEMRQRLDVSIAASLTSREILHRIGLPPAGRAALAEIINRVEISYFGSHQPQVEEYEICRRSFTVLTESLRARAVA